jgi:hypothetical protein
MAQTHNGFKHVKSGGIPKKHLNLDSPDNKTKSSPGGNVNNNDTSPKDTVGFDLNLADLDKGQ